MMKGRLIRARLSTGIVIIVAAGLLTGFRTDALRANWKYAGAALSENGNGHALAFYDAENVQYLANGDVQVWVKAVDASEIDRLIAKDKEIMTRAAEQTSKSYYPSYILSDPDPSASADAYIEMILWEEAANHADAKPRSKRLYEINCRERKILTISTILYRRDGTTTYTSDFDRWAPIIPDSTGDTLRKMLCR